MMNTTYSKMVFTNSQPDQQTAIKLNKLRDDLSTAIASGGGTPGTGDMTKAIYDTNNNGVCDTCDSLAWSKLTGVPAIGTGDMTKAVYDTNNNGFVDTCDSLAWGSVTGKPTTFPPDSTAMLKSVYDTNNDGISDHAALADAAPWTGITGKPATFPPDATAELVARKGQINGYAGLDATGKVPTAQLPAFGTGDMLKSTYDTNGNGVVDTADAIAWTAVTGKPATFPPDSTAMLKSVYDVNGDGISDHAALADAAPWTGISGKPATFAPSVHAPTHLDNGSDPIPVVTASRTGLVPILANTTTKFFRDDGTWQSIGGGGDMLKSTYDTNNNGKVDTCDSLAWGSLTGVPATFPPDATAMLKSVYDTNANGVVDTADSIPWASVTGKPTGNLVDPGVWTNLSLGTGWTAPVQAQFRIEVNGAVSTVHFRGMIQAAYSALGATAFTAPAGAQPSMTRSCVLGGAQATGTPSDVASYLASVSSAGVCTIYFLAASAFVWADPSQTQQVYLDGLFYSL